MQVHGSQQPHPPIHGTVSEGHALAMVARPCSWLLAKKNDICPSCRCWHVVAQEELAGPRSQLLELHAYHDVPVR